MVTAQAVTAMPEASDQLFRKLGLDVNFRTCMSQNCIKLIPVSWLRRPSATKIQESSISISIIAWWTQTGRLLKSPFFKFSCNYLCSSHTTDSSETLYMKWLHREGKKNQLVPRNSIKRICTVPFSTHSFKFSWSSSSFNQIFLAAGRLYISQIISKVLLLSFDKFSISKTGNLPVLKLQ